ncbi:hypothetical protein C8F01DRAFT_665694 [Mycena amicta]|nr:hypothetical protein C8F01DRAFT_665694 [Mycena amicta]
MAAITFHNSPSGTFIIGVANENVSNNVKRHAIYFPKAEDLASLHIEDVELSDFSSTDSESIALTADDDSQAGKTSFWASNALVAFPSLDAPESFDGPYPTPAQEIAYRYRAGLRITLESLVKRASMDEEVGGIVELYDTSDEDDQSTSSGDSSAAPHVPLNFTPRPRFCPEQLKELSAVHKETVVDLRERGCSLTAAVHCGRPGCKNLVRDSKALVYHQHIHNVYDKSYKCSGCRAYFSKRFELTMHLCVCPKALPDQLTASPPSPVRGTFLRVLSRITSR